MILNHDFHLPVLLPQVIDGLKIKRGAKYIDATLGGGGYAFEIISRGGIVLGIDADSASISFVKERIRDQRIGINLDKDIFLEHGNFANLKKIAEKYGFFDVAGIIFDLGMSSHQLMSGERGFSFGKNEPLDMRIDKRQILTAAKIINTYSIERLYEIFSKFAEELNSRPIAEAIFRTRTLNGPIESTGQLVEIIDKTIRNDKYRNRIIARIFQALRVAVNDEINKLKEGLQEAIELLAKEGRLIVLSYHSLEDRMAKFTFREEQEKDILRIITIRPIRAGLEEIEANPKARSAKLRIAEKTYDRT